MFTKGLSDFLEKIYTMLLQVNVSKINIITDFVFFFKKIILGPVW